MGLGCAKISTVLETADGGASNDDGSAPNGNGDGGDDDGTYVENWPELIPSGKVDLLFVIDNSASMGDKQSVLANSAATLIDGLVRPPCLSPSGIPSGALSDPRQSKANRYGCPAGTAPAFMPVNDMHVGAISSSLGGFGGDVCAYGDRTNDHGRLFTSTSAPDTVAMREFQFFPWALPSATVETLTRLQNASVSPITDANILKQDVQALVNDMDQTGCGLEAQLESLYHFLSAPDPWVNVKTTNGLADYGTAVDTDLLKQRKNFLRPDSFLAIVMLTDEDDSSPDPRSIGGQGWAFSNTSFPGSIVARPTGLGTTAPRATSACATDPVSGACTSCGFVNSCITGDPACEAIKADPSCHINGGYYGPTEDSLNVRYHHMKQRFGVDPQYPINRYVDALTHSRVPARSNEHTTDGDGRVEPYDGIPRCRNPIFAGSLPDPGGDYCKLPAGPRRPEQVALLVIGGVPNQLLYTDLENPVSSRITPTAWAPILGANPDGYNYAGIDPHMVQSVEPRAGLPLPGSADNSDPIHGREWNTDNDDLQYACTFTLPSPKTCTGGDPSCDCNGPTTSPVCSGSVQTKGKAYPTPREFRVAKGMGESGIIGSICPIQLDDPSAANYGYRPSFDALLRRIVPFLEQ
ncbi:hypothetical protein AKJ09_06012 [Labilithrix luteola]|uniref:Uncharacterized protein n=2 Tax=Labilithrix luteola TaxID=1391654 RepID=A0A0K1Q0P2_9BACT|nr:hypothetical protein AKJ09_06012 [Labilithrix luteola]